MNSIYTCDLDALTVEQRHRHNDLAKKLRPAVVEFRELSNGYAAEFSSMHQLESEIEEFMTLERLCCPFFTLRLENRNEAQPLVLKITGPGEIKPFIRAEFGIPEIQSDT